MVDSSAANAVTNRCQGLSPEKAELQKNVKRFLFALKSQPRHPTPSNI